MSTDAEKREAIKHAVECARSRLARLEALEYIKALSRAQEFELEQVRELIKRGEHLLKEHL